MLLRRSRNAAIGECETRFALLLSSAPFQGSPVSFLTGSPPLGGTASPKGGPHHWNPGSLRRSATHRSDPQGNEIRETRQCRFQCLDNIPLDGTAPPPS